MQISLSSQPPHSHYMQRGWNSSTRSAQLHRPPTQQHHSIQRAQHTCCRFKQTQSDAAEIPLRLRQRAPDRTQPTDPAIPQPQEVQASVMLVPKDTASEQVSATDSPLDSFLVKCRLAWNLFFPPSESSSRTRQLSPKELGKQRLSMILVADKCGLSPNSLVEMKRNTLAALQDCMDLEDLQDAALRFTMTRENGVTYSMAVPILRPDPYAQEAGNGEPFSATASWEEEDEFEAEGEEAYHEEGFAQEGLGGSAEAYAAAAASGDVSAAAAEVHRAASPVPTGELLQQEQLQDSCGSDNAEITPGLLKELLVEELVHDVEELVEQLGPQAGVQAVEVGDGELLIAPTAVDGAAAEGAGMAADVLAEQLEAAVAEVQHFGEAGDTGTEA